MDSRVESLIKWVIEHNHCEPLSRLLPTGPHWQVDTVALIDSVADIFEIDKREISELIDDIQEARR